MIKHVNAFFHKHAYLIFTISLFALIGFVPLLDFLGYTMFLELIVTTSLFISAVYFFHKADHKFLVYVFTPITLLGIWLTFFFSEIYLLVQIEKVLVLILMFFITTHLLSKIFKSATVTIDVIYAAISGYIMIGLISSILCWFIYTLYPGSYNINFEHSFRIMDFTYYAIVTMSTLGYGDITPQTVQSESLAILITLIGQFYMTVLMALLIGKYLVQLNKEE